MTKSIHLSLDAMGGDYAPEIVVEGAKAIYDVTEDEIQALRQFVPEWSKNSTLIPIRTDDGELRYIDFSHSNAYDVMARPFRTLALGINDESTNNDYEFLGWKNSLTILLQKNTSILDISYKDKNKSIILLSVLYTIFIILLSQLCQLQPLLCLNKLLLPGLKKIDLTI